MRGRRIVSLGVGLVCMAGATLIGAGQPPAPPPAGQQGLGQAPGGLPLTPTIREKGSSVTPAFEGWYYEKDGSIRVMVGYFNRNTKQSFDIPAGPNNHVDPGGPDQGQPTHFDPGRGWGVFTVAVPKDFTGKNLTWTIVANGYTNTITLHTHPDYIVEPYMDAASQNTPPKFKFAPDGKVFTGPPNGIAARYTGTVGVPVPISVWVTDEGPKINIPERQGGRGRGRGRGDAATGADAAAGGDAPAGRGAGRGRGAAAATGDTAAAGGGRAAAAPEFTPPPPLAVIWTKFRGPGDVKFDKEKPSIDKGDGKSTVNATFSAPGDYILRIEGNDTTGQGGGGFQCCWSNAHVGVTIK